MKKTLIALVAAALAVSSSAFAQQKVKIGFISTFSGPGGVIGGYMRDSVELESRIVDLEQQRAAEEGEQP